MNKLPDLDLFFLELKKKKILKGDVATAIGVGNTYLSKVISGEKPMTDSLASALHKHYGDTQPSTKTPTIEIAEVNKSYLWVSAYKPSSTL